MMGRCATEYTIAYRSMAPSFQTRVHVRHVQGGKQPVPERMALIQWLDSYDRVASCAFSEWGAADGRVLCHTRYDPVLESIDSLEPIDRPFAAGQMPHLPARGHQQCRATYDAPCAWCSMRCTACHVQRSAQ